MQPILQLNSRGFSVIRLQKALNATLKPSPDLSTDGLFGEKTEAAVKTFQRIVGLAADGIVGPRTWAVLEPSSIDADHGQLTPAKPVADAQWMAIAQNEVGQSEIPGAASNQRIIQYHSTTSLQAGSDEIAWCSSFVNWCLLQAGIRGTNSAAATSWLSWGQQTQARQGAIAVIHNPAARNTRLSRSGNHVAFLVQASPTHYILLGGNQSDQVRISRYPKSKWQLKGYRWPN